jgi:hypothetical protein
MPTTPAPSTITSAFTTGIHVFSLLPPMQLTCRSRKAIAGRVIGALAAKQAPCPADAEILEMSGAIV